MLQKMIPGINSYSDLKRLYTEQGESVLRAFLSEKIGRARQGYLSLLIMSLYLLIFFLLFFFFYFIILAIRITIFKKKLYQILICQ